MLVMLGGGLPGLLTSRALELIRNADVVYVDTYTMPEPEWLEGLARVEAKGRVVPASRELLEQGMTRIVEEARDKLVVVLVPGDPLIATTHIALLVEARRRGVEWLVVPGVSGVVSAMTLSSLQFYRFGRTITIPGPWRGIKAYSVVEYLRCNLSLGLHTLLLLDYESGRQLQPGEAAGILLELEGKLAEEKGWEKILPGLLALVVERAGYQDYGVEWHRLASLASTSKEYRSPSSIVVPGYIHETESEALQGVHGVPRRAIEEHNRLVRGILVCP